jgi:hypothetical protein
MQPELVKYWDQSAAAIMLQLKAQGKEKTPAKSTGTFCTQLSTYKNSMSL